MDPKKPPVPRRVWRMTTDAPQGEILDVGGKPAEAPEAASREADVSSRDAGEVGPERADGRDPIDAAAADAAVRVLNPAKVPSWRASSYDLLTGLTVRDVTDTIPGAIFDELFKPVTGRRPGDPEGPLNRRASAPASSRGCGRRCVSGADVDQAAAGRRVAAAVRHQRLRHPVQQGGEGVGRRRVGRAARAAALERRRELAECRQQRRFGRRRDRSRTSRPAPGLVAVDGRPVRTVSVARRRRASASVVASTPVAAAVSAVASAPVVVPVPVGVGTCWRRPRSAGTRPASVVSAGAVVAPPSFWASASSRWARSPRLVRPQAKPRP